MPELEKLPVGPSREAAAGAPRAFVRGQIRA